MDNSIWRAWFCRIYVVVVFVAWNATLLTELLGPMSVVTVALLIPLVLVALFMTFSLAAFKLEFSMFGTGRRAQWPDGPAITSAPHTGGSVGWYSASAPFISWSLFAEGVGVRCLGVGAGFVPLASIDRIETRSLLGGCKVLHRSAEVRSPLVIPSTPMRTALERLLAEARERGGLTRTLSVASPRSAAPALTSATAGPAARL